MTEGAGRAEGGRRRRMSRSSAGSALLNVFGELATTDPVPTATVVHALTALGHEPEAVRQALVRGRRAGWLENDRGVGSARWALSAEGRRVVADGIRRVEALGTAPETWDGRWLVLLVPVPQQLRSSRPRLYRSLAWSGFGSPSPGLWVSPYPERAPSIARAIERLELAPTTLSFVGAGAGVGLSDAEIVARAWSLDEVDERYAHLVAEFSDRRPPDDASALRELLSLDQELQRLPALDPQLPLPLTGARSGRDAAARLLELRREWQAPASAYFHGLLAEADAADQRPV